MRIWDLRDSTQKAVLFGYNSPIFNVAITNDNKYIVAGGQDKTVRIWNIRDKIKDTVLSNARI